MQRDRDENSMGEYIIEKVQESNFVKKLGPFCRF